MLANNMCCCVNLELAGKMDTSALRSYYGTYVESEYKKS